MARVEWKGAEVVAKVAQAAKLGVDRTMAEAVDFAKRNHRWVNRTSHLESSIVLMAPAHTDGTHIRGSWGATAAYALFVEIGTSRMGLTARQRAQDSGGMWTIPAPTPPPGVQVRQSFTILPPGGGYGFRTVHTPSVGTGPLKEARAFLRPAQDVEGRFLAIRIAQAFRGEEML